MPGFFEQKQYDAREERVLSLLERRLELEERLERILGAIVAVSILQQRGQQTFDDVRRVVKNHHECTDEIKEISSEIEAINAAQQPRL